VTRCTGARPPSLSWRRKRNASALLVGKYLSPEVIVQYEQVLEQNSAFYVRLEYTINRFFAVETTASQGDESGLAVKWAKDY